MEGEILRQGGRWAKSRQFIQVRGNAREGMPLEYYCETQAAEAAEAFRQLVLANR